MLKFLFSLFLVMLFIFYYNWYVFVCFLFVFFMGLFSMINFNIFFLNMSYGFGGDSLTFSLIFLSVWIVILMILSSGLIFRGNIFTNEFLFMVSALLFFLFLSFSTDNLFKFYLFFECSLIPTMILIFGWGYQPERLSAGYYLLFYTLFFSLPMLLGIFFIYGSCLTLNYFLINIFDNTFLYIVMMMSFMVKMPLVFIHFWLPKAHVEAPISGSMILAAVLLKLGGYGILRVFNFMVIMNLNIYFSGLSFFSMFMVGLLCLFQLDMKMLIAYSSVSHMGMVICGLMSINYWGILGSLILMIGHGFCSSGMFCLANIIYERSGSRILFLNKGLICIMPSLSMFWFLFMASNSASPPTLNLLGEIFLINGIVGWSTLSIIFLMFSSFISCVYSMYLYSYINHGNIYSGFFNNFSIFFSEYLLLLLHIFPLNILFMKFDMFCIFSF